MIKQLTTALVAVFMTVTPGLSRIETGTGDLLRLLPSYGVDVHSSSKECPPNVAGMFITSSSANPQLHVCHDGNLTADDHDTVRHEVWHFIQSCRTGTHNPDSTKLLPLLPRGEFITLVNRLPNSKRALIRFQYPKAVAATELEAFAAARFLSADQIANYMRLHCRIV